MSAAALREVLGASARHVAAFPLPAAVACRVRRTRTGFTLLGSRSAPAGCQVPYFVGPEIAALALGAEHGRATSAQVEQWARRKLGDGLWRLTSAEAIGGLPPPLPAPLGWSLGRVLVTLGVEPLEVYL